MRRAIPSGTLQSRPFIALAVQRLLPRRAVRQNPVRLKCSAGCQPSRAHAARREHGGCNDREGGVDLFNYLFGCLFSYLFSFFLLCCLFRTSLASVVFSAEFPFAASPSLFLPVFHSLSVLVYFPNFSRFLLDIFSIVPTFFWFFLIFPDSPLSCIIFPFIISFV